MDTYSQIILSIVGRQETIIGPVAVEQAEHVPHLKLDWSKREVHLDGDPSSVVDALVQAYSRLFGKISIEVSKEAAAPFLSQLDASALPHTLR